MLQKPNLDLNLPDLLRKYLTFALENLPETKDHPDLLETKIEIELSDQEEYGDYSTNLALILGSKIKKPAREIAEKILDFLAQNLPKDYPEYISKAELAGTGFLNFTFKPSVWQNLVENFPEKIEEIPKIPPQQRKHVNLEFVSANPTGPINVVNARAAVLGDAIAALLKAVGFEVVKEFYVNDAGHQVDLLTKSLEFRFRELLGEKEKEEFPQDGYHGQYVVEIASKMLAEKGPEILEENPQNLFNIFKNYALNEIIEQQEKDLSFYGVDFDLWFHESQLYEAQEIEEVEKILEKKDFLFQKDGATYIRTSQFFDCKDEVLRKSDGNPTYFLADLAYHKNKFKRGFDWLIDIWGQDHHGHQNRMKSSLKALGYEDQKLTIIISQMVHLIQAGEKVKMSKRAGEFITLRQLIEDVGKDAARFFMLQMRPEAHLEFDLELASKHSSENPVYYLQYAHARICSIFSEAEKRKIKFSAKDIQVSLLQLPEEINLIKKLYHFFHIVLEAALHLAPHKVAFYMLEIVATFHHYYNHHRVLSADLELSQTRLFLIHKLRKILQIGGTLLGISMPTKM